MFSLGVRDLPSWVTVSIYRVPTLLDAEPGTGIGLWGTSRRPHNPLLRIFSRIDLTFVIRVVLSLFSLLMVFDSFSGERERGTLPMVMACSVRRLEVAAGKFLGAVITVAVPLTIGFLGVVLLWGLSEAVELSSGVWTAMAIIFASSLVYLSAFLAVGMWMSLWIRESSAALMALLLVWVGMAVIIPEGLGYLANYGRPREARREMMVRREETLARYTEEYWSWREKYPLGHGGWVYSSMGMGGGESVLGTTREAVESKRGFCRNAYPLKVRAAEEVYRLSRPYEQGLLRWARARRGLLRLSLSSVFGNLVEATAGTGLDSHESVLVRARQYREQLVKYLRPKMGEAAWFTRLLEHPAMETTEENKEHWRRRQEAEGDDVLWDEILTWDKVASLDLTAMPRPRIPRPSLVECLESAWLDISLLLAFALAALVLMGRQSLRAPILR